MTNADQLNKPTDTGRQYRRLSAEKLFALRRLRHARRLWKKEPLFAFATMVQAYPGYTHTQFLIDLTRRSPRRSKKRTKMPLSRYGRYSKMMELLARFHNTGDPQVGKAAIAMRKIITRPYRMQVQLQGTINEYTLSPMIAYQEVEKLNCELKKVKTWQQVQGMIEECRSMAGYGR